MATLSGQSINTTFGGLIKMDNNAALTGLMTNVTDGVGTATGIQVSGDANQSLNILSDNLTVADKLQVNGFSLTGTNMAFAGAIDFSSATVTGLPGGAGLIENPTQSTAIQSDLTDLSATASAYGCVAIGRNALANNDSSVAYGNYASATGGKSIAIGTESSASAASSFAFGWTASATAPGAIAMGYGLTASTANTLTTRALELVTNSTPTAGGIIMSDAGGTDRRLNIDASGNLQVDSTPVGVTPSYTFTTPVACPDTGSDQLLVSLTIPGGTFTTGDVVLVKGLWKNTSGTNNGQIWISNTNSLFSGDPVAVGSGSQPSVGFMKSLYIAGTTNSNWFDENFPADTGFGNFSQYNSTTLDWANDVYIIFQGYVDPGNAGSWIGGSVTKLA